MKSTTSNIIENLRAIEFQFPTCDLLNIECTQDAECTHRAHTVHTQCTHSAHTQCTHSAYTVHALAFLADRQIWDVQGTRDTDELAARCRRDDGKGHQVRLGEHAHRMGPNRAPRDGAFSRDR